MNIIASDFTQKPTFFPLEVCYSNSTAENPPSSTFLSNLPQLISDFLAPTPHNMICVTSLLTGSWAAAEVKSLAPLFFSSFFCLMTPTLAQPNEQLTRLLGTIKKISDAITNFDVGINTSYSIHNKLKPLIEDFEQDKPGSATHLTDAIFKLSTNIQIVLNPIHGIITSTMDALKDEALTRLTTLAELKKMYDEYGALTQLSIKLQGSLERHKNANIEYITKFINKTENLINAYKSVYKSSKSYKNELETAVHNAKAEVTRLYQSIEWNKRQKVLIQNELTAAYDLLEIYYDELSKKIELLEKKLNTHDEKIQELYKTIDLVQVEITIGEAEIQKMVVEVSQRETGVNLLIHHYDPILKLLKQAKANFITNYDSSVKTQMQKLSDLLKAKYAQLRIELDQANARLNSPSTPKTKTKEEL